MIVDAWAVHLPISELNPGSVFCCPQSQEPYIVVQETIETGEPVICVRLKDGKLYSYVIGPLVDWYPSARLVLHVNS